MIQFIKRRKILSFLLTLTIIFFLLGIFFYANLDLESRGAIASNINALMKGEGVSLSNYFFHQTLSSILIWLFGISIIGVLIVLLIFLFEVFLFSFELCSLIATLGLSHFLFIFLYSFPQIIFLLSLFVLCFYSIHFSYYLFSFLFLHKTYSFSSIMKRYIRIYLFSFIGILISCLAEYFFLSTLI